MSIEELKIVYEPLFKAILKQSNQGISGCTNNDYQSILASIYGLNELIADFYQKTSTNNPFDVPFAERVYSIPY